MEEQVAETSRNKIGEWSSGTFRQVERDPERCINEKGPSSHIEPMMFSPGSCLLRC